MREISANEIITAVERLVLSACCVLPSGASSLLDDAVARETNPAARSMLVDLQANRDLAAAEMLPLCQDTGMAVLFCELGQELHITGGAFEDAINEGVRRGYVDGKMRLSVVRDPIRRGNTNTNTPAVIHTRVVPGDKLAIKLLPKGFGSENMSAMRMFNPTASTESIEEFIASVAIDAGANPCPPVILGVGLGGTVDSAAVAAKYALGLDGANPDEFYASMEKRILDRINSSGVGCMGMGGDISALAVRIIPQPTHIAGLPCVVNVCCHCARHAEVVL